MQERRKFKRKKVSYYLPLSDPQTLRVIGHLVDITPQGLMIDTHEAWPVGDERGIRLETIGDVAGASFITFAARCKWKRKDPIEPNLVNLGLEITRIAPADAEILGYITEKYGSQ